MKKHINPKANERFQNETSSSIPPFHVNDPASILDYIGSLIPSVANLPENYGILKHLGLNDEKIANIIKGNLEYIFGEISVPHKPRLHVQCGIARVSIKEEKGTGISTVHIDDIPLEQYVRSKMQAEKETKAYLESHTKEELFKRIKSLEEQAASLGEQLTLSEESRKELMETLTILSRTMDKDK